MIDWVVRERASLSPDGGTFLLDGSAPDRTERGIYTYRRGEGAPRLVIEHGWDAAWSPDATRIAFVSLGAGSLRRADLFVADADGGDIVQLTNDTACDDDPVWNRDGTRITFTRAPEGQGGYLPGMSCGGRSAAPDIYTVAADGSDLAILTASTSYGEMTPDWSPDGSRLVFQCFLNRNRICIYNPATDRIREIYSRRDAGSDPSWSPNGRRIAFVVT
ncbi:MAG TPA: hypothetical protein VG929_01605, partial [Actinomycetota bacterium]|nr:hypothetical protein [Actinomycetota bacterium]